MNGVSERFINVAGGPCRVWEAGDGPLLGVIPGHGGFQRWSPFLAEMAKARRVVAVSLPGFPGSGMQYERLDGQLDWITATIDLLEGAGLKGADLLASSVAAMVAADVAAVAPDFVRSLSLAGPYGLYDPANPTTDFFAHTPEEMIDLLCADRRRYDAQFAEPDDVEQIVDWRMTAYRAGAAAARLVWPVGDRGLSKRLHRIKVPVQLVWGADDRIIPPAYAEFFAKALPGPVSQCVIPGAGHLVWLDQPERAAAATQKFLAEL